MSWWKNRRALKDAIEAQKEREEEEEEEEDRGCVHMCSCTCCGKNQLANMSAKKREALGIEIICASCRLRIREVEALEKIATSLQWAMGPLEEEE